MNKFIKFTATLILALGITACGDDPKAEYKKITEWSQQQQATQQQVLQEFQTSLSQLKSPEEVEPILKKYEDGTKAIVDSLDKVDVKSKEIKELKEKSKAVLNLSIEVTRKSVKSLEKPLTDEEKAELQAKVSELQASSQALTELDQALAKKYGETDKK
ncbi:hypothetical protein [Actinobacillus porcinus]|uniref:hypothetical protein n=1 Tax=Actinobacillus porcinus TaxID=51048 RepID=UPI0023524727|nr:hypothetical protein [Actinobacillus porcinus]MCI5763651.1 hypothetical protein [Actinobacillus porcinus]MDY5422317.1 hypothetical protein [Actinobacillus porcinus]MDY6215148.1 hypothetical protein [Actinobacillus porcinus]